MSSSESVTYKCPECDYANHWTRDEVIQRGVAVVYKATPSTTSSDEDQYSLKCRNPRLNCPGRMIVAVERRE